MMKKKSEKDNNEKKNDNQKVDIISKFLLPISPSIIISNERFLLKGIGISLNILSLAFLFNKMFSNNILTGMSLLTSLITLTYSCVKFWKNNKFIKEKKPIQQFKYMSFLLSISIFLIEILSFLMFLY